MATSGETTNGLPRRDTTGESHPPPSSPRRERRLSPLAVYLREIAETPLLTADQEKQLACRIQDGDREARDQMARANLRLVVSIARKYAGKGIGLEDLIAEGNLGLMHAVERFDPAMNTRFSTYAKYWISQSIKRLLVRTGKTIRAPDYAAHLLVQWRNAEARLQEELGRPPTQDEVGLSLNLSRKKLIIVKMALRVSGSSPRTGHGQSEAESPLEFLVADQRAEMPEARATRKELVQHVLHHLDQLEPREATVLRLRFGLAGEGPLTLMQIGERLGLTRERIRQIEEDALGKLSDRLQGEANEP